MRITNIFVSVVTAFICFFPSSTAQILNGGLQEIVTWDSQSIYINGKRVMILSGEFHPFRLPSPSLWLDVFQKIHSLGFNCVSFYINWAQIEGEPGQFRADGIFALEGFFESATAANIYLIARPGPYINAEVSGGGFPGWLQPIDGVLRSTNDSYLDAAKAYIANISSIISKAQITNGGPVIMVQAENEYTYSNTLEVLEFLASQSPDLVALKALSDVNLEPQYMADIEQAYLDAGIVVPLTVNDAVALGNWAPDTGLGAGDIYGMDAYPFPLSGNCPDPYYWAPGTLPARTINYTLHLEQSPSTPYSITEFQGGAPSTWGGTLEESCNVWIGPEFERLIYKEVFAQGAKYLNLYMDIQEAVNTSYDYGAAITEERLVSREKYSELKLQGNFRKVSPAYLLSSPQFMGAGIYTNNQDLFVTRVAGEESTTSFYVVRHTDYTSYNSTTYQLSIDTSIGNISIPQLGGNLTLNSRDSKIHVCDYDIGGINLIYSSAEIFTWTNSDNKTTLILYGAKGETHEFAFLAELGPPELSSQCTGIQKQTVSSLVVVQWDVVPSTCVVSFGNAVKVYLLWRNEAYNYWALDAGINTSVIVKAGYLMRNASITDNALYLNGDINATTTLEIIAAPLQCGQVFFNGQLIIEDLNLTQQATLQFVPSIFTLPDFSSLDWKYIDSLPEIQTGYDDSNWTLCSQNFSNMARPLTTATSLYAGDYEYYTGSLEYRGHFVANGNETIFQIVTQGGDGYGHSIWLNDTFIGSWTGTGSDANHNGTYTIGSLVEGSRYVITVLIDHMGLEEESFVSDPTAAPQTQGSYYFAPFKTPRGILDYSLDGHTSQTDVTWKMTGNLGGVHYQDLARGPMNEGSMFAERQGYHLPGAPTSTWESRSPLQGIDAAGVGFFATEFELDVPSGYDVPMSFVFGNVTTGNGTAAFRCQIFVNGYQFGKYVNNIGPQTVYPVPQGVLNHNGHNFVALTLWSLDGAGAALTEFSLEPQAEIMTGYRLIEPAPQPGWAQRTGAY
ncbi:related beta-galactosidase E [Phialocephala subalpina]|uniref:Beta-galactosidase n=1 Tax=Phialocephala subalpina TaxID=576137 RepID=A0A1L7XU08_9HELO|nr:related beta-galactosidase E [Phialocephala subalpina]